MLLKTALKNLKRSPIMNMICLLQLTAVFLIAAVMTSTMSVRYRTYAPLEKYLSQRGIFAFYNSNLFGAVKPGGDINNDAVFSVEELGRYMNAEKAVVVRLNYVVSGEIINDIFIYDDETLKWNPEIERGKWLSTNADELEIVISEGVFGLDVGDEAEFILPTYHGSGVTVNARVVGVLREDANILGERSYTDGFGFSYRNLSNPLYKHPSDNGVICISNSELNRFFPEPYEQPVKAVFFMYGDASENVIEEAIKTADSMRATEILRLEQINKNSKSYLRGELLKLLPIVIMLLILVIVSAVSISAIATRRRLKDYAKYYVLGLQWKQCAVVNLFQTLITGAAALLISIAALFAISLTPLSQTITIIVNSWLVFAFLGILALYLVFSMIMPLLMLRSTTPKALLQAE